MVQDVALGLVAYPIAEIVPAQAIRPSAPSEKTVNPVSERVVMGDPGGNDLFIQQRKSLS